MKCRKCGSTDVRVIETRETDDFTLRRRRICNTCGEKFTTYETYETSSLYVIKKSGKKEVYDRTKLEKILKIIFAKRLDSENEIRDIVDKFESKIKSMNIREIKSEKIGEMIVDLIREKDVVSSLICL